MQDTDIAVLINQESFLNYCFERNDEDMLYWENWLLKNAESRKEIEELKRMLIVMGNESRNRIKEEDFASLQAKINKSELGNTNKVHSLWSWAAAAAVIFLIAVSLLYNRTTLESENIIANDIAPGGNKATLILANGKRVNLTDASNGSIASQSGIKIIKAKNGQLIYEVSGIGTESSLTSYNTIEIPFGGQYQVNLSDGTKVWLNAGSSLRYPLKFSGSKREVQLLGEGYFEVAHNREMPFNVRSGKQTIEVLGTHFNVMAYADEKAIKTSLLEGSVKIHYGEEHLQLIPGQQAQFLNDKVNIVGDADMEEVIAWKNGYFKFNEDLVGIMNKISRWYGVKVIYQMKPDSSLTYSGKISRSRNISAILKIISFDGDVHFRVNGKIVYVTNN
ncbi:FecR family protein [Pedobacter sp. MC2016-14]|uniref:FecR family protein n=1 Tax=Pedobacter sp. MC2016-14 TaxID=2897327 RepID=UPI001E34F42E|nr:FecR family protein [Pedobacter sp. MC2016-14]MCD0488713.1 FecR family protein [Pedobacter sp. MC2016-14]